MSRNPMLAKIHIARKELNLDDATYRAVLERITQKASSKDCTDAQLERLIAEFKRLGWTPKVNGAATKTKASPKLHVRKIFALWGELERAGALTHFNHPANRAALNAFVQRQTGVSVVDWLTGEQANKVTEGLKAMLKRHRLKTQEAQSQLTQPVKAV